MAKLGKMKFAPQMNCNDNAHIWMTIEDFKKVLANGNLPLLCEVLDSDMKVKPHFDFDMNKIELLKYAEEVDIDIKTKKGKIEVVESVKDALTAYLEDAIGNIDEGEEQDFNITFQHKEISLKAKHPFSMHVLINGRCVKQRYMLDICKAINDNIKSLQKPGELLMKFDTTVYKNNQKFNTIGSTKIGENRKLQYEGDIGDNLIQYLKGDEYEWIIEDVKQPDFSDNETYKRVSIGEIDALLGMMSDDRFDDRDLWLRICGGVLNSCFEVDINNAYKIFDKHSKRSKKYGKTYETWESLTRDIGCGLSTLKEFAKEDNPKAFLEYYKPKKVAFIEDLDEKADIEAQKEALYWDKYKNDIFSSDQGFMRIFVDKFKDNIKVINPKNDGECYIYNKTLKIWELKPNLFIKSIIGDYLESFVSKYRIYYSKLIDKEEEREKRDKMEDVLKDISKILHEIRTTSKASNIAVKCYVKLYDEEFSKLVNKEKHLYPIANGKVLNFKTGIIEDRTKEMRFTFFTEVNFKPDADLSKITNYFNQIMCGDKDMVKYLQKVLGYSFTGETYERCMFIFYGGGANGKGSVMETLQILMKSFYITSEKDLFIKPSVRSHKGVGTATPHLMSLIDGRLATFSEVQEGDELNETDLKRITGEDSITARNLFKTNETFKTQCKLILQTNFKPKFNIEDQAMIDRLRYVPFNARFCEFPDAEKGEIKKDPNIIKYIRENGLSELFTFIALGAIDWYQNGMGTIPKIAKSFTTEALGELDTIQNFVGDCLEKKDKKIKYENWIDVKASDIYSAYKFWCNTNDKKPLDNKKYGNRIKAILKPRETTKGVFYDNWRLKIEKKEDDDDE